MAIFKGTMRTSLDLRISFTATIPRSPDPSSHTEIFCNSGSTPITPTTTNKISRAPYSQRSCINGDEGLNAKFGRFCNRSLVSGVLNCRYRASVLQNWNPVKGVGVRMAVCVAEHTALDDNSSCCTHMASCMGHLKLLQIVLLSISSVQHVLQVCLVMAVFSG